MRRVLVIGIGSGNPEHVTVQAVNAMKKADVFFVMDKGQAKTELVHVRKQICDRYLADRSYRLVEVRDPERDRASPAYRAAVQDWYRQRADIYERLINDELDEGDCGAFLVWGDPSLYDGTIRILQQIATRASTPFTYEVVPGITSIQALAARHGISLSRIGESILITTGRRLVEGLPDGVENIVVMLDADCSFSNLDDDLEIYWGAYLGSDDEILASGPLRDRAAGIEQARREARSRKGWIMDTYLLRHPVGPETRP